MILITIIAAIFIALIGVSDGQHAYGYFGRDYSTNMYSHQPFMCYECTNNYDASNTRYKDQATPSCGFAEDFNPKNPSIRRQVCYTYCLKKEVGMVGSRIDVERRCEPTCQEYNGNTQGASYLVDRVSCCVGNYCNRENKIRSNFLLLTFISLIGFTFNRL